MIATIKCSIGFQAVPNNSTLAHVAGRRQQMNRAFETVKRVVHAILSDGEALVVLVPTCTAFVHGRSCFLSIGINLLD